MNSSGAASADDVAGLYANLGGSGWLYDLNVDGAVNLADVTTMITNLFRTVAGDFNVDGAVDAADYVMWRKSQGISGAQYTQGDADLDGDVDDDDLTVWTRQFGFVRQALAPGVGSAAVLAAVPEARAGLLIAWALVILGATINTRRTQSALVAAKVPNLAMRPLCSSCLRG